MKEETAILVSNLSLAEQFELVGDLLTNFEVLLKGEERKENLLEENDELKRIIFEMTHHDGAQEETKFLWLPVVQNYSERFKG